MLSGNRDAWRAGESEGEDDSGGSSNANGNWGGNSGSNGHWDDNGHWDGNRNGNGNGNGDQQVKGGSFSSVLPWQQQGQGEDQDWEQEQAQDQEQDREFTPTRGSSQSLDALDLVYEQPPTATTAVATTVTISRRSLFADLRAKRRRPDVHGR